MGTYEKNADLVSIGAYKAGTNPAAGLRAQQD